MLPAVAHAETRQFIFDDRLSAAGGEVFGPATEYPARIIVSGVSGTVTKATVKLLGVNGGRISDGDVAIVGPNAAQVMLISDGCGFGNVLGSADYLFDDSAPGFLSSIGPCPDFQDATFQPSNYGDPDDDDFSDPAKGGGDGGPAGPYTNRLSAFNGISPNGNWDLFFLDDTIDVIGLFAGAWVLTLEIQPPAPEPPSLPSNAFTIGELNGNTLSVDIPSEGEVEASDGGANDPAIRNTSVTGGPGTVEVPLEPTKATKRKLKSGGKVKLDARISFTPSGGATAKQTTELTLVRKKQK